MCRREVRKVGIKVVEDSAVAIFILSLKIKLMHSPERFENIYHAARRQKLNRPQSFNYVSSVYFPQVPAFLFVWFLVRYCLQNGNIFIPLSACYFNGFS
jgi:hypothetical protein